MSSLGSQAESPSVLDDFRILLSEQKHMYACGGRIPIAESTNESEAEAPPSLSAEQPRQSDPVTIRWDVSGLLNVDESPCRRLTLPITKQADHDALSGLIKDCQPATFGSGGQDVYDETYRKALKLNPDAFCSTFDPYSLGIVDSIAQILLPSFLDSTTHRAVEARLYKLNVYSGPSGMFKTHVDTPRSPMQFGSLVICLPVEHQGGQLKVRHKGEETTFDWSMLANQGKTPHIEWAAFYSDCEHEVMEVSGGNRLTLTYNLFAVRGVGHLTGNSLAIDPTRLPLYHAIEKMISHDPFSGQGGTLDFWCSHAYAYNHEKETPLPETLKGVDAAVWESFKALGIDVKIAPMVKLDDDEMLLAAPEYVVGKKFGVMVDRFLRVNRFEGYNDCLQNGHSELQIVYTAYDNDAVADTMYSRCAILANLPVKDSTASR
ncbi:hypothetical protein LLEC1_05211 [Akanthomyces lecanii]|uniref:Fe2OG dioxygenase domain-containing protein n=1 Tax=Cordyceps confragosa TaxID=2714763 RepID=A0A179IBH5_CORDF|nr:hypothetical protein LLEC1_05211 [Akanthomyces lecanii]